jgi:hypothetical protein
MSTLLLDSNQNIESEIKKSRVAQKKFDKQGNQILGAFDLGPWYGSVTRDSILNNFTLLATQISEFRNAFNHDLNEAIQILSTASKEIQTLVKGVTSILNLIKIQEPYLTEPNVTDLVSVPDLSVLPVVSPPPSYVAQVYPVVTKNSIIKNINVVLEPVTAMLFWMSTIIQLLVKFHELRTILAYIKVGNLSLLGAGTYERAKKLLTTLAFIDTLSLSYKNLGYRAVFLNEILQLWTVCPETEDPVLNNNEFQNIVKTATERTYKEVKKGDTVLKKLKLQPTACKSCQLDQMNTLRCRGCRCNHNKNNNNNTEIVVELNKLPGDLFGCDSEQNEYFKNLDNGNKLEPN